MFEVEERHAQGLCDGRRNGVVLVKRRKLVAPSVESEIQDRKLWRLLALYKNRAVVPTPWLIGENVKKLNAFGRAGAEKFSDSLLLICATDIDADNLRARKCLHHFNEGRDNAVPPAIAKALGIPLFNFEHFILEGGSIETNGRDTLLTTESCLLNPNRNPTLDRAAIEKKLREKLGVRKILWLGDGIEGDDTDGHVDDITRFIGPSTVITAVEEDEHDPNFEPLQRNLDRLHVMRLADGEPLHVLTLPMPTRIMRDGQRLPASYANFYIANSVVLLPIFSEHNDAWAVSALHEAFPTRRIVPIDCRELIWGLGAFHCLTQQQPAVG